MSSWADEHCDVTEMLRATCVHCRPRRERLRLEQQERDLERTGGVRSREVAPDSEFELGPAAVAKFSGGKCPACHLPITVGEEIRLHVRGWMHSACL